jgi:hypothetical protein
VRHNGRRTHLGPVDAKQQAASAHCGGSSRSVILELPVSQDAPTAIRVSAYMTDDRLARRLAAHPDRDPLNGLALPAGHVPESLTLRNRTS